MKVIARPRGTNKTKQLIDDALYTGSQILTTNKRALQQKIEAYERSPVPVIDLNDLVYGNYDSTKPLMIHKIEDVFSEYLKLDFNLELIECSITTPEPKEPIKYI